MSAGRLPQLAHSEPPGQNWRQKLEFWCEQLRECARKPSRRRVHGLRAATLRLQAELDETLQHSTTAPAAVRAAQRWHRSQHFMIPMPARAGRSHRKLATLGVQ